MQQKKMKTDYSDSEIMKNRLFAGFRRIPLRFYSMFFRTLLVMSVLVFAISGVFVTVMSRNYRKRYFDEIVSGGFESMDRYRSGLESVLASEQAKMDSVLQSESARRLMIAGENLPQQQLMTMLQELSDAALNDSYVSRVCFYPEKSGQILTSDGEVLSAEESGMADLFAGAGDGLFLSGDALCLADRYPANKPLGTLVYFLDKKALYDVANGTVPFQSGYSRIYVYDKSGNPVFGEYVYYPNSEELRVSGSAGDFLENGQNDSAATVERHVFDAGNSSYLQTESSNGLIYVRKMEMPEIPLFGSGFGPVTAAAAVFAVLSLVLASFLLLRLVFWPFHTAISDILGGKKAHREELSSGSANELELIRNIAADDQAEKEKLQNMILAARESVQTAFFRQLIMAGPAEAVSRDEIQDRLDGLKSRFRADGIYTVLRLWHSVPVSGESLPFVEQIFLQECASAAKECWSEVAEIQILPPAGLIQQMILSPKCSGRKMQEPIAYHVLDDGLAKMAKLAKTHDFRFAAGTASGEGAENLNRLDALAAEDLRKRLYFMASRNENDAVGEEKADAEKKAREDGLVILDGIIRDALSGSFEDRDLTEKTDQLIRRIAAACPVTAAAAFSSLMDRMTERMIQYRADIHSEAAGARVAIESDSSPWTEKDQRIGMAETFFREGILELAKTGRNNQFRYVERASALIREQYYDPTLSLEGVSDSLGLSPQYLSRLFTQWKPQGFLWYVNSVRISRAEELLRSTGLSVNEIGMETGFSSAQSFIRVFRKYTGMTPGQYRKSGGQEKTKGSTQEGKQK